MLSTEIYWFLISAHEIHSVNRICKLIIPSKCVLNLQKEWLKCNLRDTEARKAEWFWNVCYEYFYLNVKSDHVVSLISCG